MTLEEQIKAAREANKHETTASMARQFNVKPFEIRKHLVKLGLPTKVLPASGGTSRTDRFVKAPLRFGLKLSTLTVGAICELHTAANLLKRGFVVFRAVAPNSPCDLIATFDNKAYRIEVRASNRNGCCVTKGSYDCLAAVHPDGTIDYRPSLEVLTANGLPPIDPRHLAIATTWE